MWSIEEPSDIFGHVVVTLEGKDREHNVVVSVVNFNKSLLCD